jgi:cell filamentation protein
MTMYVAGSDPYCYAGTSVLKNVPGIRNQADLEFFENAMVRQRSLEPLPRGNLSVSHYRSIHRHLFQDVYRWAGRFRTVRTHKGDSTFCYPEHIAGQMATLFADLRQAAVLSDLTTDYFAARAAHFVAELNAIHPFREGNGRTQLAFMGFLGTRAGHPFALERLVPEEFLEAMIESFGGSEQPLAEQLRRLLD